MYQESITSTPEVIPPSKPKRTPLKFTDEDDPFGYTESTPDANAHVAVDTPTINIVLSAIPVPDSEDRSADDELRVQEERLCQLLVQGNPAYEEQRHRMEEWLYNLHDVMVLRAERKGEFKAFLKEKLGWGDRADDKARRWIASYRLRKNMITTEDYNRIYGNGGRKAKTPVPPPAPAADEVRVTRTEEEKQKAAEEWLGGVDATEEDVEVDLSPLDADALDAANKSIDDRCGTTPRAHLFRIMMRPGLGQLYRLALREQQKRFGVTTLKEVKLALAFVGRKAAEPGDEEGELIDELCREAFLHPELAEADDNRSFDEEPEQIYRNTQEAA